MRLYLIRHGQSLNNFREHTDDPRVDDPPLTSIGEAQAQRLADMMTTCRDPHPVHDPENTDYNGDFGITHIFVSPMHRALQTAAPLAAATGIAPMVWDDIHETGGIWLETEPEQYSGGAGMHRVMMQEYFPTYVLPDTITDTGWWNKDREIREAAYTRGTTVAQRLRDMVPENSDAVIAMVMHQHFIGILMQSLFSLGDSPVWFNHYNSAFARIDFREDGVMRVRYVNRFDHLDRTLLTT